MPVTRGRIAKAGRNAGASDPDRRHVRRAGGLRHEFVFGRSAANAGDVVVRLPLRVGKKDLGLTLLNNRVPDRTLERVLHALRREQHDAVLLSDNLDLVFREVLENLEAQRLPEFVDGNDEALPGDQGFHPVEQVSHGRAADVWVVED